MADPAALMSKVSGHLEPWRIGLGLAVCFGEDTRARFDRSKRSGANHIENWRGAAQLRSGRSAPGDCLCSLCRTLPDSDSWCDFANRSLRQLTVFHIENLQGRLRAHVE
jgi:hypothetical protein